MLPIHSSIHPSIPGFRPFSIANRVRFPPSATTPFRPSSPIENGLLESFQHNIQNSLRSCLSSTLSSRLFVDCRASHLLVAASIFSIEHLPASPALFHDLENRPSVISAQPQPPHTTPRRVLFPRVTRLLFTHLGSPPRAKLFLQTVRTLFTAACVNGLPSCSASGALLQQLHNSFVRPQNTYNSIDLLDHLIPSNTFQLCSSPSISSNRQPSFS